MLSNDSDDKTRTHFQLVANSKVGHYRILEKIGAGGMGDVYLAEDTELNRKVALKFLPPHLCQDADCRARFKREAQAAAKLDHPNIVSVFEVGEFQGRPFFSMQHVEGQSLKEVLSGKALPLDRILEIGIQVCEGLQAAHEKGVTHRDIKPSNILIDSHSRARIVDFGLASVIDSDHLTKTGSTLGTMGYMSPEQVRGEKIDHRTDLFSFGVVLYELITGHAPFKADSEAATLHAITSAKPELLARFRREVPSELQAIVDKALEKNVSTRYQHADDMSTDLKRLTSRTQMHPAVKRTGRRIVWSWSLIVVLIAGALVLKPWQVIIKPGDDARAATKRVVVVPFKNQTGDPSLDPLGRLIADWTSQSFLETHMAEVVPPEMLSELDFSKGTKSIVNLTGASLVVTGSYYQTGDSIQFQAQVTDSAGALLQALEPQYAKALNVMEGVEIVRQKVLGAVAILLDERLIGRTVQTAKPPKYEAYLEYVDGCDLHTRGYYKRAIEHHQNAYAIDTSFLEPLLGAVSASSNIYQYHKADSIATFLELRRSRLTVLQRLRLDAERADLAGNLQAGLEAMRQAAQLVPGSMYAYQWGIRAYWVNRPRECIRALMTMDPKQGWARGWLHYWAVLTLSEHILGEHQDELKFARQARDIYPDRIEPLCFEARALIGLGRIQEAITTLEQCAAQDSTPRLWMVYVVGELRRHGHEDAAMEWTNRALTWYESRPLAQKNTLLSEYAAGLYDARRWREAKAIFEELAKESPDNLDYQMYLGCIAARMGDRETAMVVMHRLGSLDRPFLQGLNTYYCACIAAVLGDKDIAVRLLRDSISQGKKIVTATWADFDFESLWDYPPYIELMKPKG